MNSICRRCGFIVTLSIETIRVENKGLCEYCIEEYKDLVLALDEQRKEAFINFELNIGENNE